MADVVAAARLYAETKAAEDRQAELDGALVVLGAALGPLTPQDPVPD